VDVEAEAVVRFVTTKVRRRYTPGLGDHRRGRVEIGWGIALPVARAAWVGCFPSRKTLEALIVDGDTISIGAASFRPLISRRQFRCGGRSLVAERQ